MTRAKEPLKVIAKASAASLFAWIRVALLGVFACLLGIGVAIALWSRHAGVGFAGAGANGAGAIIGVLLIVFETFWPSLLFAASIGAGFLYIPLANRYAIQTAVRGIWSGKLEDSVIGEVHRLLEAMSARHPDWAKRAGNAAKVKLAMLQALKTDASISGIRRRAVAYGIRKLTLDDVDLAHEDTTLATVLSERLRLKLSEAAEPSFALVWVVFGVQVAIGVLAITFDRP